MKAEGDDRSAKAESAARYEPVCARRAEQERGGQRCGVDNSGPGASVRPDLKPGSLHLMAKERESARSRDWRDESWLVSTRLERTALGQQQPHRRERQEMVIRLTLLEERDDEERVRVHLSEGGCG